MAYSPEAGMGGQDWLSQSNLASYFTPEQLRALGYKGGPTFQGVTGQGGPEAGGQWNEISPDFAQWLAANGYDLSGEALPGDGRYAANITKGGTPVTQATYSDAGGLFDVLPLLGSAAVLGVGAMGGLGGGAVAPTATGAGVAAPGASDAFLASLGATPGAELAAYSAANPVTMAGMQSLVPSFQVAGAAGGALGASAPWNAAADSQLANTQLGITGDEAAKAAAAGGASKSLLDSLGGLKTILPVAGALAGATSGGNGTQSTTQQQIDPRIAAILYGANGSGGFLGQAQDYFNANKGGNANSAQGADMLRSVYSDPHYSDVYRNMIASGQGLLGSTSNPFAAQFQAATQGQRQMPDMRLFPQPKGLLAG